ncbi:MAG: tRNA (adenosine(37)-N6)-dimethylallyltransferase MiaA [Limnochordia bacterium]
MPGVKLLVIVGPTAVGKSNAGLMLAKKLGGEIVSADSMQVYKLMDIGTAKPTKEEQSDVAHHLIDVVYPWEQFSAAAYQELADVAIQDISRRGKIPIILGGTGLYITALVDGFLFPDKSHTKTRRRLEKVAENSPDLLYQRLTQVDPVAASKIHPNNIRRVIRALEVYYDTKKPISLHQEKAKAQNPRYRACFFGLTMPRPRLYERINQRVDQMIDAGLLEEAKSLMDYGPSVTSMQALGYKELWRYLFGECSFDEAVRLLKRDTRRYAKRQYTWFKRDPRIQWIDLDEVGGTENAVALIVDSFLRFQGD